MRYTFPLLVLYLLLQSCRQENISCDYILSHVNIIDVENGKVLPDRWVAIRGERIVKICDIRIDGGDSAQIIEGEGKYLIPGLWDMHAHYWWCYKYANPLLIGNGVTGIREMFGSMIDIVKIRAEAKEGNIYVPEIISSGAIIDGVPASWPGSDTISVAARANLVVEKQVCEKVDFLKVYSGLSRECYFQLAKEAKKRKISFEGHVPYKVTIYEAIEAGQKSLEHLYGIIEVCVDTNGVSHVKPSPTEVDRVLKTYSTKKLDSLFQKLAKSQTWLCPTLTVLKTLSSIDDSTLNSNDKYMPYPIRQKWKKFLELNTMDLYLNKALFNIQRLWLGSMEKQGVKVLAGTDFSNPYCYPGFSLHNELQLMVEGGMTVSGALKTATFNPAIFLGKEKDYGTVSEGKYASLVLLDKNPLEEIKNTQEICSVFLKGKFFSRKDIREMLKSQENK